MSTPFPCSHTFPSHPLLAAWLPSPGYLVAFELSGRPANLQPETRNPSPVDLLTPLPSPQLDVSRHPIRVVVFYSLTAFASYSWTALVTPSPGPPVPWSACPPVPQAPGSPVPPAPRFLVPLSPSPPGPLSPCLLVPLSPPPLVLLSLEPLALLPPGLYSPAPWLGLAAAHSLAVAPF